MFLWLMTYGRVDFSLDKSCSMGSELKRPTRTGVRAMVQQCRPLEDLILAMSGRLGGLESIRGEEGLKYSREHSTDSEIVVSQRAEHSVESANAHRTPKAKIASARIVRTSR